MSDSYTSSLNQAKAHKQLFVNALSTCTKEETQELKLKWMEAYKAATEAISNSFK